MRRAAGVALAVAWLAPIATAASPDATPPAHEPGHPLGIGEPRAVQPYTVKERLLEAARQGDRAAIEAALARGADPTAKDDLQRSALLLATRDAGNLDIVRLLHAKGATIDDPDIGGRAAISWAAAAGRLDLVQWLAKQGADTDRADVQGHTPLFHAVLGDHADVVVFLIDRGARADVPDAFGDTPFIMACAKGYGDVARLLLARGADPLHRDQEGRTAADRAVPGTDACSNSSPR